MFKNILVAAAIIFAPILQGASAKDCPMTPKRKVTTVAKMGSPSPKKKTQNFINFRDQIVEALENDNLEEFSDLLMDYFNKITYPMQIRETKFYASLFYWILRELSDSPPTCKARQIKKKHPSKEEASIETLKSFISNKKGHFYAFEVFIYENLDSESEEPLSPERINEIKKYKYVTEDESPVEIVRIYLEINKDYENKMHRKLTIAKCDTSHAEHIFGIYSDDFSPLLANNALQSPIRSIIHILDHSKPDFVKVAEKLEVFYNDIPTDFTKPFRSKNCEKFYHSLLFNIFNLLRFNYADTEFYTKSGRGDLLLSSMTKGKRKHRPIIIELKHNGSALKALNQIKDQEYAEGLELTDQDQAAPLMVGVNIESNKSKIAVSPIVWEKYGCSGSSLKQMQLNGLPLFDRRLSLL